MSEEMNKELETEVIAGVTAEEPVETMEDLRRSWRHPTRR